MIGLLQRVTSASVSVDGEVIGQIGRGLVILVAVHRDDEERDIARLAERILGYRVLPDAEGRMNRSVRDESAGRATSRSSSSRCTATSTMRPRPISPMTSPSTLTLADVTRCSSPIIIGLDLRFYRPQGLYRCNPGNHKSLGATVDGRLFLGPVEITCGKALVVAPGMAKRAAFCRPFQGRSAPIARSGPFFS